MSTSVKKLLQIINSFWCSNYAHSAATKQQSTGLVSIIDLLPVGRVIHGLLNVNNTRYGLKHIICYFKGAKQDVQFAWSCSCNLKWEDGCSMPNPIPPLASFVHICFHLTIKHPKLIDFRLTMNNYCRNYHNVINTHGGEATKRLSS